MRIGLLTLFTIFTVSHGNAIYASMEYNDPQRQKDIRQIIKSGERGTDLVEQLLQLGRSEPSNVKWWETMPVVATLRRVLYLSQKRST